MTALLALIITALYQTVFSLTENGTCSDCTGLDDFQSTELFYDVDNLVSRTFFSECINLDEN